MRRASEPVDDWNGTGSHSRRRVMCNVRSGYAVLFGGSAHKASIQRLIGAAHGNAPLLVGGGRLDGPASDPKRGGRR